MLMFSPKKFHQRSIALLLLAFISAACVSTGEYTLQNVDVTSTVPIPTPNNAIVPTVNKVVVSTFTPSPDPTETRMVTSTEVLPVVTSTNTPFPTLSPAEEGAFLSTLMITNGGCNLPCWWGIIPGKTDVQEARDLFASQGIDDWVVSFDNTHISTGLGYPNSNSIYRSHDVGVEFTIHNNLIQTIRINGGVGGTPPEGDEIDYLRNKFIQDWHAYSPAMIISKYGTPNYVELAEVKNSPYYRLELSYEKVGLEIAYFSPFEYLNDDGRNKICFSLESIDLIYLSLYSPGSAHSTALSIIPNRLDSYISWESVTGSDLTTFQQLFGDVNSSPCVEIEVK